MSRALAVAFILTLALPAPALAGRWAVGLERGARKDAVAARVARATGGQVSTLAPFALVVQARSARGVASLRGVSFVERLDRSRRLAFTPTDPLLKRQWYVGAIRAFDAWPQRPSLFTTKVAIIDSGIDASHPELENRIADARSFVDNEPRKDSFGHGTFVAGIISAGLNNGSGIAGIAFSSRLLVAKVVRADGTISPEHEARAIRWAVDAGAQVINLSLAALRDPLDGRNDLYSPLEASAIEYAVRRGVVVVAAVGNGDGAPRLPWRYASYPAALPHVIGVGAMARDGSVPDFSNRDPVYTDLAAPGEQIFSTVPRALAGEKPCPDDGYSWCGREELRRGEGTSFAAAQVSAAAALVLAERPTLAPEQVRALLERNAADLTPASGCKRCRAGRDELSGWGLVDVAAAVRMSGAAPPVDDLEPNDYPGSRAAAILGRSSTIHATIDYWDDPTDVYRVFLRKRQRLFMKVEGLSASSASLAVWQPGIRKIAPRLFVPPGKPLRRVAITRSARRLPIRAGKRGWHFVEVKAEFPAFSQYTLTLSKR
ncbi:MAG: S8 family serine peptidase [Actinomycetota bacterium]|nr:S8 family serine peptidase [Actinomycetota bacterium]